MSDVLDCIVMGGGVVGLCAAIALRQRGYTVTVLDASIFQVDALRVYAINDASEALLQSIGVWAELDKSEIAPYERMFIWDARGKSAIDFDARLVARNRLGVMLQESTIKTALLRKAHALEIPLIPTWQIQAVDIKDSAITVYSKTSTYSAEGLIVADGARSPTRSLLGVPMVTWPYDQSAIVAKVSTTIPHHKTAFQIFCPEGPLAFLPMAHAQESSIVWSTSEADRLMALSDRAFEQELTAAFANKLGPTTLLSARQVFPLRMQHVKCYTGKRWVLLGDAAHTMHPMAGLGLNIGLADLAAWLEILPEHAKEFPRERQLRGFHRQRQHAVWQVILFLQALHILFAQSSLPMGILRSTGLRLCNRLPCVKEQLIAYAAGLA